jgi:protein TonB
VTPPPQEKEPTPRETHNSAKAASAVREHQITTAPLKLPPHVEVPNDKKVEWPEGFVHMSHADLAAADISKIHSTPSTGKSDSGTDGGGSTTGEGPGGAHLYRAEWYREPRDSEIDGYMRPGQSSGRWAKLYAVLFRTITSRIVANWTRSRADRVWLGFCVKRLGNFLSVPHVNGKPQLGTWVSIRFTFEKHRSDGVTTDKAGLRAA